MPLLNGKDLSGWQGATDGYEVVGGELRSKAGVGGNRLSTEGPGLRARRLQPPSAANDSGVAEASVDTLP